MAHGNVQVQKHKKNKFNSNANNERNYTSSFPYPSCTEDEFHFLSSVLIRTIMNVFSKMMGYKRNTCRRENLAEQK